MALIQIVIVENWLNNGTYPSNLNIVARSGIRQLSVWEVFLFVVVLGFWVVAGGGRGWGSVFSFGVSND